MYFGVGQSNTLKVQAKRSCYYADSDLIILRSGHPGRLWLNNIKKWSSVIIPGDDVTMNTTHR